MKVIGINGSPRKGFNTGQLTNKILEGAKRKGAETKLYHLEELNISPCRSCFACKRDMPCSIKDDMGNIIEEIKSADAVVIASPLYMLQMTGQTKTFIDRLFPLTNPDTTSRLRKGIKALAVFTQANPNVESFKTYYDYNELVLQYLGFEVQKTFIAGGTIEKNDIQKQEETIKKAIEIGENLV